MVYQLQFGMGGIEPFRLLPAGHEMYFPHPRGKLFHSPKPVSQKTVVSKPGFRYFVFPIVNPTGIFREIGFPLRVVHVHPGNNKINFHHLSNKNRLQVSTANYAPAGREIVSMARCRRRMVSFFPISSVIRNMPGPLGSPTTARRSAFMMLPVFRPSFLIHSITRLSWCCAEKSLIASINSTNCRICPGVSAFHRLRAVFSS